MTVAVVVDGGASLPHGGALAARCTVVPMRLDAPVGPGGRTAAASPGDFLEAIERADEGEGVVVVTVAAGLSASHQAARSAAGLAGSRSVLVVDSRSATAGQGLVALEAARAAVAGAPLAAAAAAAERAAGEVRLAAQIERLDDLARGGRLPRGVAAATRRAGVRVLFELREGRLRPLRPAFGLAAAEARLVASFRRSLGPGAPVHVAALHAGAAGSATRLLEAAAAAASPVEQFVAELSPLMLAHTGEGVSGLAWRLATGAGEAEAGR